MAGFVSFSVLPSEILERILHHLPPNDLLFAQRVCRPWRDAIQHSLQLQQDLFLAPTLPTQFWSKTSLGVVRTSATPHAWSIQFTSISAAEAKDASLSAPALFSARLNHLIATPYVPGQHEDFRRQEAKGDIFSIKRRVLQSTGLWLSWRNIFVTQPPVSRLIYKLDDLEAPGNGHYETFQSFDDSGIRWGQVIEELKNWSNLLPEDRWTATRLYSKQAIFICSDEEVEKSFVRGGKW